MAGSMASGLGFVWGSLLAHTGIASIIGAGGYSLYEISHGEETKGLTDLLKVAFSAITLGQNMQVTINGGGNSGGTVSNSGAFVLNGSGELSFAFSGEVTFEQGMVVIQGIAGNPSGGSSTGNTEEKSQDEIDNDQFGLPKQANHGVSKGGRHYPKNLEEKLAMEEVMTDPSNGKILDLSNDGRWPKSEGWVKMVQNVNGYEIHYQYNLITKEIDDVKLK